MIAYLAMQDGPVTRVRLSDLFWPYQCTAQARHSLRNCLYELRKTPMVQGDHVACWLSPGTTSDVARYNELLAMPERGALREACQTFAGEFLDGLPEIPTEPWNEWLAAARERLNGRLVGSLMTLSRCDLAAGRHSEAIATAQRVVQVDPFGEPGHRQLMQALHAGGRRSEAKRCYKRIVNVLRTELSCMPDLETQRLALELFGSPMAGPMIGVPVVAAAVGIPAAARTSTQAQQLRATLQRLGREFKEVGRAPKGAVPFTRAMVAEAADAMLAAAQTTLEMPWLEMPRNGAAEFDYRPSVSPPRETVAA